jgi:hypothetical protein
MKSYLPYLSVRLLPMDSRIRVAQVLDSQRACRSLGARLLIDEPVPVSNGGIAPSGAEPRDIAAAQFAQKVAGLILINLPGPLLKLVLGRMRQEHPPRKLRTAVTVTTDRPEGFL